MKFLTFALILLCMHLLGSAVLFGILSGWQAVLASPFLGLFGWPFLLPEALGLFLLYALPWPDPESKFLQHLFPALVAILTGGFFVALFTPKESGSESLFWFAGFCAGASTALFAYICVCFWKHKLNPRLDFLEKDTRA